MKTAMELNRRQFLWLTLGFGSLLFAVPRLGLPASRWQERQKQLLLIRFTGLLKHRDSAKVIGLAYLQGHPQEETVHSLLKQLVTGMGSSDETLIRLEGQDFKKRLQQRIRQDFTDGKVVKVQGWILSITEARLYALTTLV